jgi:hypothetical protein
MNLGKRFYQLLYEHRKTSHKTYLNNTMRTNSQHIQFSQRRRSSSISEQNPPELPQTDIYSPNMDTNSEPMDTDPIVLPKDVANRIHLNPVLEPTPEYSPRSKLSPRKEGKSPQPKKVKVRKIIRAPPNPNYSAQPVEPVVGNINEYRLRIPSRVPRQRAATEGDSIRPEIGVSEGRYFVGWNVSPSKDPNSRSYKFESNRSITQILENLKDCFAKFEMELTEAANYVSPGEPIKLKGQGKYQEGQVEVELITSNGNTVASFTRSPNLFQEYFCNIIKEVELESVDELCVL